MFNKITNLVCVMAGLILMYVPAAGQEKVEMRTVEVSTLKQDVELRASVPADSVVTFAATGEKTEKTVYTRDEQGRVIQEEILKWENNRWVNDRKVTYTYDVNGEGIREVYEWESNTWNYLFSNTALNPQKGIYGITDGGFWCNVMNDEVYCRFSYGFTTTGWAYRNEVYRDSKGNISRIVFYMYQIANPNNSYLAWDHLITYNDQNLPVLINAYDEGELFRTDKFEYDSNGNVILYEYTRTDGSYFLRYTARYDANNNLISGGTDKSKTACQMDSDGNLAIEKFYTWTANRWYETHYKIYYPNDLTPSVEPENNNPIGNDNKGGFDVIVNIPTDSIAGGSYVVKLPEGFTLEQNNTKLTVDFGIFDLVITQQENNAWLFELKPKSTRSVLLRSGDASKPLAQIAYVVDERKERGTYDVTVHSIEFSTPGGYNLFEPAITVPAQLNRWGVSNAVIENSSIRISDGNLYIRTDKACMLSVFTISGQLLRQQTLGAGETFLLLPQGIYFVKVGETMKKIIAK